jgi:hypothetical protein
VAVPDETLEGWLPEIGPELSLAQVVDLAFDYRGNTTIVRRDGSELVGYVFNRDAGATEPYLLMFDEEGNGPIRVAYAQVLSLRFSGRDTAAGTSWKAWTERREAAKRGGASGADPHRD